MVLQRQYLWNKIKHMSIYMLQKLFSSENIRVQQLNLLCCTVQINYIKSKTGQHNLSIVYYKFRLGVAPGDLYTNTWKVVIPYICMTVSCYRLYFRGLLSLLFLSVEKLIVRQHHIQLHVFVRVCIILLLFCFTFLYVLVALVRRTWMQMNITLGQKLNKGTAIILLFYDSQSQSQ